MISRVSRVGLLLRTDFFRAKERLAAGSQGDFSLYGLPPEEEKGMWLALLILGGAFAVFLAAFLSVRWGGLVRNPERRNPWVFLDPGGGGS